MPFSWALRDFRTVNGNFCPRFRSQCFETDDAVFVVAEKDQNETTRRNSTSAVELPNLDERMRTDALQELGAAELMLAPESKLIGKALGDLEFPRATTFRCWRFAAAVRR